MKVALLGTGILGSAIAQRLLNTGHALTVYNRTVKKAKALESQGAFFARHPLEAIEHADCIILVLTNEKAVHGVLLSIKKISLKGKTIIQMGTILPHQSLKIQAWVKKHKGTYFECPVLGSRQEALKGQLLLMAGSTKEQFEEWKSFLKDLGPARRIGEIGKAAVLKLALNNLIASQAAAFCLSLAMVQKYKIDINDLMDILRQSAVYSPMFDKKLERWLSGNYKDPNFTVGHLLKDVDLIQNVAYKNGLSTEIPQSCRKLLISALRKGHQYSDYSAILEAVYKK